MSGDNCPSTFSCQMVTIAFVTFQIFLKYSVCAVLKIGEYLSGSLSKSGPLDFGTKNNFPSFFVSEKGLAHIYKKAIYYFPVSYFCFATSQN